MSDNDENEEEEPGVVDDGEEEEVLEDEKKEDNKHEEKKQKVNKLEKSASNKEENEESDNSGANHEEKDKVKVKEKEKSQSNKEEEKTNTVSPSINLDEIKDPEIAKLLSLDLEKADKDEVVEILMKKQIMFKPKTEEEERNRKRKMNSTAKNVTSRLYDGEKYKFFISELPENFEELKSFDKAKDLFLGKLNEKQVSDNSVLKLLKLNNEKKTKISREEISEKVNKALSKKQEDLQKLINKCNEDYKKKHTFTPVTNITSQSSDKGNLKQFLEEQTNYIKKKEEKIDTVKKNEIKKLKEEKAFQPKIDKKSVTMATARNKENEPVHERLFNRTKKTEKLKTEKKVENKDDKKNKPKKYKNKLNVPSKVFDEKGNVIMPKKKEEKNKKDEAKLKQPLLKAKDINTSKLLYNNLKDKFEKVTSDYFTNVLKIENQDENSNNNYEKIKLNKLSLQQLYDVFALMGMCKQSQDSSEKSEKGNENNNEPSDSHEEKKLIADIWENLKNDESMVKVDEVKKFIICIFGYYPYDLYLQYRSSHPEEDKKDTDDKVETMINTQDKDNNSKINKENQKNNKYVSFDNDNNLVITLSNSKNIKKNFKFLVIFSMYNKKITEQNNKKKEGDQQPNENTFKPKINDKSEELAKKLHEKIVSESNQENDKKEEDDPHMQYINRLLFHKKKQQQENEKLKEEYDKEALKECTFKPQTLNVSTITKVRGANRFNELFKKGSEKEKNRKDKSKDEYDYENNLKECTFHPQLIPKNTDIPETKFSNDIYGEKSYKLLYERLNDGRVDRQIKDSCNDRYEMNNYLKDYLKKKKLQEFNKQINSGEDNDINNQQVETNGDNEENLQSNDNKKEDENPNKNEVNEVDNNINVEEGNNNELENKEVIPLLIIDVNIGQGVKKKIYVYEGDTPEGLADKFAKEHNLEPQTKEKLQGMIRNHMMKLLTRIDEENPSISEKSGTHIEKEK